MKGKFNLDDIAEVENPISEIDELNKLVAIQIAIVEATKVQVQKTELDYRAEGSVKKTLDFIEKKIEIMERKASAELEALPLPEKETEKKDGE